MSSWSGVGGTVVPNSPARGGTRPVSHSDTGPGLPSHSVAGHSGAGHSTAGYSVTGHSAAGHTGAGHTGAGHSVAPSRDGAGGASPARLCRGGPLPRGREGQTTMVLTCQGDFNDPALKGQLRILSQKLQRLVHADNGKLTIKKVEPWNSVKVTFNIPLEAARRLRALAQRGDEALKRLGITAVQLEGDQAISLTITGKNNETTEVVLRTGPPGMSGVAQVAADVRGSLNDYVTNQSSSMSTLFNNVLYNGPPGPSPGPSRNSLEDPYALSPPNRLLSPDQQASAASKKKRKAKPKPSTASLAPTVASLLEPGSSSPHGMLALPPGSEGSALKRGVGDGPSGSSVPSNPSGAPEPPKKKRKPKKLKDKPSESPAIRQLLDNHDDRINPVNLAGPRHSMSESGLSSFHPPVQRLGSLSAHGDIHNSLPTPASMAGLQASTGGQAHWSGSQSNAMNHPHNSGITSPDGGRPSGMFPGRQLYSRGMQVPQSLPDGSVGPAHSTSEGDAPTSVSFGADKAPGFLSTNSTLGAGGALASIAAKLQPDQQKGRVNTLLPSAAGANLPNQPPPRYTTSPRQQSYGVTPATSSSGHLLQGMMSERRPSSTAAVRSTVDGVCMSGQPGMQYGAEHAGFSGSAGHPGNHGLPAGIRQGAPYSFEPTHDGHIAYPSSQAQSGYQNYSISPAAVNYSTTAASQNDLSFITRPGSNIGPNPTFSIATASNYAPAQASGIKSATSSAASSHKHSLNSRPSGSSNHGQAAKANSSQNSSAPPAPLSPGALAREAAMIAVIDAVATGTAGGDIIEEKLNGTYTSLTGRSKSRPSSAEHRHNATSNQHRAPGEVELQQARQASVDSGMVSPPVGTPPSDQVVFTGIIGSPVRSPVLAPVTATKIPPASQQQQPAHAPSDLPNSFMAGARSLIRKSLDGGPTNQIHDGNFMQKASDLRRAATSGPNMYGQVSEEMMLPQPSETSMPPPDAQDSSVFLSNASELQGQMEDKSYPQLPLDGSQMSPAMHSTEYAGELQFSRASTTVSQTPAPLATSKTSHTGTQSLTSSPDHSMSIQSPPPVGGVAAQSPAHPGGVAGSPQAAPYLLPKPESASTSESGDSGIASGASPKSDLGEHQAVAPPSNPDDSEVIHGHEEMVAGSTKAKPTQVGGGCSKPTEDLQATPDVVVSTTKVVSEPPAQLPLPASVPLVPSDGTKILDEIFSEPVTMPNDNPVTKQSQLVDSSSPACNHGENDCSPGQIESSLVSQSDDVVVRSQSVILSTNDSTASDIVCQEPSATSLVANVDAAHTEEVDVATPCPVSEPVESPVKLTVPKNVIVPTADMSLSPNDDVCNLSVQEGLRSFVGLPSPYQPATSVLNTVPLSNCLTKPLVTAPKVSVSFLSRPKPVETVVTMPTKNPRSLDQQSSCAPTLVGPKGPTFTEPKDSDDHCPADNTQVSCPPAIDSFQNTTPSTVIENVPSQTPSVLVVNCGLNEKVECSDDIVESDDDLPLSLSATKMSQPASTSESSDLKPASPPQVDDPSVISLPNAHVEKDDSRLSPKEEMPAVEAPRDQVEEAPVVGSLEETSETETNVEVSQSKTSLAVPSDEPATEVLTEAPIVYNEATIILDPIEIHLEDGDLKPISDPEPDSSASSSKADLQLHLSPVTTNEQPNDKKEVIASSTEPVAVEKNSTTANTSNNCHSNQALVGSTETATSAPPATRSTSQIIDSAPQTMDSDLPTVDSAPLVNDSPPSMDSDLPTVDSAQTTEDSAETTKDSAQPTIDSAPSTEDSAQPTVDSAPSTLDSAQPTIDSAPSTEDSAQPTVDAAPSTLDSAQPTVDAAPSTVDSAQPTVDSAQPTVDSAQPTVDSTEIQMIPPVASPSTSALHVDVKETTPDAQAPSEIESSPMSLSSVASVASVTSVEPVRSSSRVRRARVKRAAEDNLQGADGATNSLKDGATNSLKDGTTNSLKDGAANSLKDGATNSLKDGATNSLKDGDTENKGLHPTKASKRLQQQANALANQSLNPDLDSGPPEPKKMKVEVTSNVSARGRTRKNSISMADCVTMVNGKEDGSQHAHPRRGSLKSSPGSVEPAVTPRRAGKGGVMSPAAPSSDMNGPDADGPKRSTRSRGNTDHQSLPTYYRDRKRPTRSKK